MIKTRGSAMRIKKQKLTKKTKQILSLRQKTLKNKNPSSVRKSKRLIEKEKLKKNKSSRSQNSYNDTKPQQKKKNIQNQTPSKYQNKQEQPRNKPLFEQNQRTQQKQKPQRQQKRSTQPNENKTHQNQSVMAEEEEDFSSQDQQSSQEMIFQHFEHHYISSLTPMASDIETNFANIHTHTDRSQRNHSEAEAYIEYHITCLLLNHQNPVDSQYLSQSVNEAEYQLDEGYNILVRIALRYLDDQEVHNLRKAAENKSKSKSKRKYKVDNDEKCNAGQQKQRKGSFHVLFKKVLNSRHIPQCLEQERREITNPVLVSRSAFKPVVQFSEQSLSVMRLFYFLWRNKAGLSVGRSLSHDKERPIRLISYLKIDSHYSDPHFGDESLKRFIAPSDVYIPFDFEKDHTQSMLRELKQDESSQSEEKQNWRIGTIEFDAQIPKRILQRIKNTEFLRSQFYVNQINIQARRSNMKSVLDDDISTRHPINFAQLFKYVKKIEVEEAMMKQGADIFLREVNPTLTFTKLLTLTIVGLQVLQPLQFIEFQCLQSIEFEGKFMYNLRSLKKLNLNFPLKKISLNKPLSLLQRLVVVQHQPIFNKFNYRSDNLRNLPEMNFDSEIIYKNPEDDLIPFELAAKMSLKSVFKGDQNEMLTYAEYNKNYLQESQVNNMINELVEVFNRMPHE